MPQPTPDDFMVVTITLDFKAKKNPKLKNTAAMAPTSCTSHRLANGATAEYFDMLADAIRARRLYAFMQDEFARSTVAAGEWIEDNSPDV